ncbi:otu family cysteine protease [Cystoisospora suis]|uniref:Otu family cysteine protease n=1 Tax=Cystoisospora suis TaxID=483139 RepID=A0A2C6KV99_9APIC|nr:otu family cysteine protease [Cystoisospora suis]
MFSVMKEEVSPFVSFFSSFLSRQWFEKALSSFPCIDSRTLLLSSFLLSFSLLLVFSFFRLSSSFPYQVDTFFSFLRVLFSKPSRRWSVSFRTFPLCLLFPFVSFLLLLSSLLWMSICFKRHEQLHTSLSSLSSSFSFFSSLPLLPSISSSPSVIFFLLFILLVVLLYFFVCFSCSSPFSFVLLYRSLISLCKSIFSRQPAEGESLEKDRSGEKEEQGRRLLRSFSSLRLFSFLATGLKRRRRRRGRRSSAYLSSSASFSLSSISTRESLNGQRHSWFDSCHTEEEEAEEEEEKKNSMGGSGKKTTKGSKDRGGGKKIPPSSSKKKGRGRGRGEEEEEEEEEDERENSRRDRWLRKSVSQGYQEEEEEGKKKKKKNASKGALRSSHDSRLIRGDSGENEEEETKRKKGRDKEYERVSCLTHKMKSNRGVFHEEEEEEEDDDDISSSSMISSTFRISSSSSFLKNLSSSGLKLKYILPDGNCLFRAFADQYSGEQDRHLEYRLAAVKHMEENSELYRCFIPEDEETFDVYIHRMKRLGTWGGQVELQALSEVYQVNLLIHIYNGEENSHGGDGDRDDGSEDDLESEDNSSSLSTSRGACCSSSSFYRQSKNGGKSFMKGNIKQKKMNKNKNNKSVSKNFHSSTKTSCFGGRKTKVSDTIWNMQNFPETHRCLQLAFHTEQEHYNSVRVKGISHPSNLSLRDLLKITSSSRRTHDEEEGDVRHKAVGEGRGMLEEKEKEKKKEEEKKEMDKDRGGDVQEGTSQLDDSRSDRKKRSSLDERRKKKEKGKKGQQDLVQDEKREAHLDSEEEHRREGEEEKDGTEGEEGACGRRKRMNEKTGGENSYEDSTPPTVPSSEESSINNKERKKEVEEPLSSSSLKDCVSSSASSSTLMSSSDQPCQEERGLGRGNDGSSHKRREGRDKEEPPHHFSRRNEISKRKERDLSFSESHQPHLSSYGFSSGVCTPEDMRIQVQKIINRFSPFLSRSSLFFSSYLDASSLSSPSLSLPSLLKTQSSPELSSLIFLETPDSCCASFHPRLSSSSHADLVVYSDHYHTSSSSISSSEKEETEKSSKRGDGNPAEEERMSLTQAVDCRVATSIVYAPDDLHHLEKEEEEEKKKKNKEGDEEKKFKPTSVQREEREEDEERREKEEDEKKSGSLQTRYSLYSDEDNSVLLGCLSPLETSFLRDKRTRRSRRKDGKEGGLLETSRRRIHFFSSVLGRSQRRCMSSPASCVSSPSSRRPEKQSRSPPREDPHVNDRRHSSLLQEMKEKGEGEREDDLFMKREKKETRIQNKEEDKKEDGEGRLGGVSPSQESLSTCEDDTEISSLGQEGNDRWRASSMSPSEQKKSRKKEEEEGWRDLVNFPEEKKKMLSDEKERREKSKEGERKEEEEEDVKEEEKKVENEGACLSPPRPSDDLRLRHFPRLLPASSVHGEREEVSSSCCCVHEEDSSPMFSTEEKERKKILFIPFIRRKLSSSSASSSSSLPGGESDECNLSVDDSPSIDSKGKKTRRASTKKSSRGATSSSCSSSTSSGRRNLTYLLRVCLPRLPVLNPSPSSLCRHVIEEEEEEKKEKSSAPEKEGYDEEEEERRRRTGVERQEDDGYIHTKRNAEEVSVKKSHSLIERVKMTRRSDGKWPYGDERTRRKRKTRRRFSSLPPLRLPIRSFLYLEAREEEDEEEKKGVSDKTSYRKSVSWNEGGRSGKRRVQRDTQEGEEEEERERRSEGRERRYEGKASC